MQVTKNFFIQDTLKVAPQLLWKIIEFKDKKAIIQEVEAYTWKDDEASHAFSWQTPRNSPMFDEWWKTYVYLIYGIHHCLNITTDKLQIPWAILIRWIKLEDGTIINGPWKLTKYLWINKEHNNQDITLKDSLIKIYDNKINWNIKKTSRIGIKKWLDKKRRFLLEESSK